MRRPTPLLSLAFSYLVLTAIGVSAQERYLAATGKIVSPFDVFRDCDVCPEMIVLPLGSFRMGSTVAEAIAARRRFFTSRNVDPAQFDESLKQSFIELGIDPDQPEMGLLSYYAGARYNLEDDPQYSVNPFLHEAPAHRVEIDLPIAMGRNEVTREDWAACVADGGCEQGQVHVPPARYSACTNSRDCTPTPDARVAFRLQNNPPARRPRDPMVGVTYADMTDYVTWLNRRLGADLYRIPTEAEWEYAARAGSEARFAQGDTLTLAQANFQVSRRESVNGEFVWDHDLGSAHELLPVDRLDAANAWGLRHMSGNASEVTSTCGEGPHRGLSSSSEYLAAVPIGTTCKRSVKGGMYSGNVELARPARRVALSEEHWSGSIGFRVVRDLAPRVDPAE